MNEAGFLHDGRRSGSVILRWKLYIKWDKDRGKETDRAREAFPWSGKTVHSPATASMTFILTSRSSKQRVIGMHELLLTSWCGRSVPLRRYFARNSGRTRK